MSGLNVNWEQIGEVLVLLFVISVVFETALTPIFNWRIFARFCEGKGIKTPFTVIVAVLLLWTYEIDIFRHIIDAFDAAKGAAVTGAAGAAGAAGVQGAAGSESSFLGRIMTGLLVAGGSGAIFNIFTKMGLRNPMQLAEKAQKAREEADMAKKAKQAADQGQQQGGRAGEPPVSG